MALRLSQPYGHQQNDFTQPWGSAEGRSPFAGVQGVSPWFSKNPSRVGGWEEQRPCSGACTSTGFIPQTVRTEGSTEGACPLCRGLRRPARRRRGCPPDSPRPPWQRVLKNLQERGYRGQSPLTGGLGGVPPDSEDQAASRPSAEGRATWPRRRGTFPAACWMPLRFAVRSTRMSPRAATRLRSPFRRITGR